MELLKSSFRRKVFFPSLYFVSRIKKKL